MNTTNDWTWSNHFIPLIKTVVGPLLLTPSTLEVDRNQATDLVVLKARTMDIACRVRRPEFSKFANQITVRSKRRSGAKTEFEKIAQGWGDWMFYGFAGQSHRPQLFRWYVIDLHSFRSHLILNSGTIRYGEQQNADGTAFRWYDLKSFPTSPSIFIASNSSEFTRSSTNTTYNREANLQF